MPKIFFEKEIDLMPLHTFSPLFGSFVFNEHDHSYSYSLVDYIYVPENELVSGFETRNLMFDPNTNTGYVPVYWGTPTEFYAYDGDSISKFNLNSCGNEESRRAADACSRFNSPITDRANYDHFFSLLDRELFKTKTFVTKTFVRPPEKNKIDYKYQEDKIIQDLQTYIDKTYGEHYKAGTVECFDAWIALGTASGTFRDTAMKYLWRAGKKGSKEDEKKDILKALHYVLLLLYNEHYKKD